MQRRIGFVGIILENRKNVDELNRVISDHAGLILARVGLPMRGDETAAAVITLVVEATTDEMGALAGRLGKLEGISVKSALAKQR
ncbi:MAG: iron-only hydrogenase system regulator [Kiritimatiellae bacterium]|nr:iron-only hydrogenase system regulator [Kiritimatiellia bacterium]